MLSDDAFEEAVRNGYSIDTRGLDGIDAFFANVYLESLKTSDARVRTVVESPGLRRLQLPKARPVHQLVASTRPRITSVKVRGMGEKRIRAFFIFTCCFFSPIFLFFTHFFFSGGDGRPHAGLAGVAASVAQPFYEREGPSVGVQPHCGPSRPPAACLGGHAGAPHRP